MQEGARGELEAPWGLDAYARMVNALAEQAKGYWGSWGPPGEAMGQGVEAWAQVQRAYIEWLRPVYEGANRP